MHQIRHNAHQPLDRHLVKVKAQFMQNAHWCVANHTVGNYSTIKEGNQQANKFYDLKKLYDSNAVLGKYFDWMNWLQEDDDFAAVQERAQHAHGSFAVADQDQYVEKVDLAGKMILIGYRAKEPPNEQVPK